MWKWKSIKNKRAKFIYVKNVEKNDYSEDCLNVVDEQFINQLLAHCLEES